MTVPVMLAACAVVTVLWPASRVDWRLRELCSRGVRRWSWSPTLVIAGGVAASAAMVCTGSATAATALFIAVTTLIFLRRKRMVERSSGRTADDLVRVLSAMVAELSVGAPPVRACRAAVTELREHGHGGAVVEGVERMACRAELGGTVIDLADTAVAAEAISWQRIGVAWQIAERHGLPLADLLCALRSDLLARRGFVDRTRAGLAGPRATAAVLAGLPVLGLALGQATGADPVGILLGGGLGGVLLVIGTALAAAGLLWAERITSKVLTA
ncbi:type II secretion system protein F [Gordonia sp. ABSL1-1]|uniref:type II secretion system F family protein n=1 Tax=Gordonia sp. ABSL1-1 TaxID=3053923 RepID=UPI00257283F1|nr:type II secretion system protein F [Gordonia sp. ABSL1-1]MDL9937525.1 type II secretion system protein F [Gordonia sp. ABSL1-1]